MAGTAPLATAADETISAVTADTDDQTVRISYPDGGAARAIEYGVFASRISITAENVQFGGEDGHTFRIRNDRGQRVTVSGQSSASVALSGRAVFEIYTAEGAVVDDPRISYDGSNEDVPVDVRGDTDMFSSGTVFDAYVVEVLADGTVLDATDEKTIGIGYEPDATATERDGGTRLAISRPEGWEDSWSAYLEIVTYDGNRVVVNERRYEFERDGQHLVVTYDAAEESPPEDGFQDRDLLFFVEGRSETSPPNLWAAIHGDLDTTDGGEQASASIQEFEAPTAVVEPGESATGTVTVRNTGDAERTFFVGYSVIAPDRQVLDNTGSTGTPVTLAPGEETTVDLSWMVTSTAPSGPYDAVTAVWKEAEPDRLSTRLDQAVRENTFRVEDGALPGGTSILPPITPETFPFSHTQSIEYSAVGPDRSGVEGDGIRVRVDRQYVDDDRMTVTVGIDSPTESLVEEISGYGVSQVLVLYNDADLTLDDEGLRSRVDGGTPRALETLRPVKNVASIASTVATGGLTAIVKEGVEQVAETVAEDWATSRIEFDTPPTLSETQDVSVIDVDFSTATVPAATSPATIDEYELEATFSVEPDAESTISVVFDVRGRSETIFTPAEGNRITGAAATSHQLPVEYRRQVNVPVGPADEPGSRRSDGAQSTTGNGPGFGVLGTLTGVAGGAYLRRRLGTDDEE